MFLLGKDFDCELGLSFLFGGNLEVAVFKLQDGSSGEDNLSVLQIILLGIVP